MKSYGIESFSEILNREILNVFEGYMDYGNDYEFLYGNSMMRAYVINKLFKLANTPELKMVDKGIIYQSCSLFDKYYNHKFSSLIADMKLNPSLQKYKTEINVIEMLVSQKIFKPFYLISFYLQRRGEIS